MHISESQDTEWFLDTRAMDHMTDFTGNLQSSILLHRQQLAQQNSFWDKSQNNLDIEVLTGNETEYIEMDLMLGVAELHTPEAVAAVESAMVGSQQACMLAASSTGSYSTSSDDESDSDSDNADDDDDNGNESCLSDKTHKPKVDPDHSLDSNQPKHQRKIIEL
ncbi:hypothetical protein NE237_011654 [Protea cynaroides]|uniref:Uncharacterized protein n=1 Tax=Protea cynaroides TaxID=273540 RepID=A0A9Q0JWY7_9MAGN|nr:hypothetical protein NE237_011654 [Protea cynaroides]